MTGPLTILTLMINKPGHRHQAEGLARVIGRMRPGSRLARIEIRPRWFAHAALRAAAVRHLPESAAATLLGLLYGIDVARLERPDVVVSSGRPALAAGVLLGRVFAAPFVYAGLADRVCFADRVDLLLVSVRRFAALPNAVYGPVPSLVEPDLLPPPRPLAAAADLRGARVALIVGGNAHSHRFCAADWQGIGELVRRSAEELGFRWRVSTSRRTGEEGAAVFRRLAGEGVLDAFVDYGTAGAAPVDSLFAADAIVVTEDSVSMMAEAVAARRPAVALRPREVKPTLVDDIVADHVAAGRLAVLPIVGSDAGALAAAILAARPRQDDYRDEIAAAIAPVIEAIAGGTAPPPQAPA